jgi:hypothetical protein
MRKLLGTLSGLAIAVGPGVALAEGVSGYSRGNAIIYFAAIGAVLIYGVHDIFHKKWLTWGAAVVIPVALYLGLPKQ